MSASIKNIKNVGNINNLVTSKYVARIVALLRVRVMGSEQPTHPINISNKAKCILIIYHQWQAYSVFAYVAWQAC